MSTGLPVFDTTVQETNLWLKDLEGRLEVSRHQAYTALRTTLHVLRDRLPPETALNFADQLPMLLRGMFIEGWSLVGKPTGEHTAKAFLERIEQNLPQSFPADADRIARMVFQTLRARMDLGEIDKIIDHLPKPIAELWFGAFV
jgi:uncharacterized protein (DUF2267 family)